MKRLSLVGALLVALTVPFVSGVAAAGKPVFAPGGAASVTAAAGEICPFPLEIEILIDRSVSKTFFDENGDPSYIIITGHVVAQFTNTATGESIVRNASGPARIVLHDDGSVTVTGRGPGWLALFSTDEGGPSLTYFLGLTTFDISATGRFSNVSSVGTTTDLCAILG